jgi:hypothetical protein
LISGVLLVLGGIAATVVWVRRKPTTTLELVAEDLVFRGKNPTLYAKPGGKVRLVFRNEANGVVHQFSIDELSVETAILQPGTVEEICFPVPAQERVFTYTCKLHPIMTGRFVLQQEPVEPIVSRNTSEECRPPR